MTRCSCTSLVSLSRSTSPNLVGAVCKIQRENFVEELYQFVWPNLTLPAVEMRKRAEAMRASLQPLHSSLTEDNFLTDRDSPPCCAANSCGSLDGDVKSVDWLYIGSFSQSGAQLDVHPSGVDLVRLNSIIPSIEQQAEPEARPPPPSVPTQERDTQFKPEFKPEQLATWVCDQPAHDFTTQAYLIIQHNINGEKFLKLVQDEDPMLEDVLKFTAEHRKWLKDRPAFARPAREFCGRRALRKLPSLAQVRKAIPSAAAMYRASRASLRRVIPSAATIVHALKVLGVMSMIAMVLLGVLHLLSPVEAVASSGGWFSLPLFQIPWFGQQAQKRQYEVYQERAMEIYADSGLQQVAQDLAEGWTTVSEGFHAGFRTNLPVFHLLWRQLLLRQWLTSIWEFTSDWCEAQPHCQWTTEQLAALWAHTGDLLRVGLQQARDAWMNDLAAWALENQLLAASAGSIAISVVGAVFYLTIRWLRRPVAYL